MAAARVYSNYGDGMAGDLRIAVSSYSNRSETKIHELRKFLLPMPSVGRLVWRVRRCGTLPALGARRVRTSSASP